MKVQGGQGTYSVDERKYKESCESGGFTSCFSSLFFLFWSSFKPRNVLIGAEEHVQLTDFGLFKSVILDNNDARVSHYTCLCCTSYCCCRCLAQQFNTFVPVLV